MPRVKRGMMHTKSRRNLLKRVKGFGGGRKNLMKQAMQADTKAGAHAYRDRKNKKREFRKLWQVRINAGTRANGMSYSSFMGGLKGKSVGLNRKVLSEMAAQKPDAFAKLVEYTK
jgi:large subunit ribosomal protein L20